MDEKYFTFDNDNLNCQIVSDILHNSSNLCTTIQSLLDKQIEIMQLKEVGVKKTAV